MPSFNNKTLCMDSLNFFFGVAIPFSMVLIMAGMGMSLRADAFLHLLRKPKPALLGLVAQMVALPAIAMSIIHFVPLAQPVALGLLLLSACPGGIPSNIVAFVVKADVELSVSLTAVNSLLMILSMPLILYLGGLLLSEQALAGVTVPAGIIIKQLFVVTVLPVLAGMAVGHYFPAFAAVCDKPVRRFSLALLVVLVITLLAGQYRFFINNIFQVGALLVVFMLLTMSTGALLAWLARLPGAQTQTIIIEVGMQNTVVAMYVATSILQDERLLLVPSAYGLLCLFVVGTVLYLYTLITRRAAAREKRPAPG